MAIKRRQGSADLINNPLTKSKLDEEKKPIQRRQANLDTRSRGIIQTGKTGVGESQYDTNVSLKALGELEKIRANKQPWQDQMGNMIGQAVVGEIIGGTIEGLGYLGDIQGIAGIINGQEQEWGNWLSDFGKGLRETAQENMTIYQAEPGSWNPSDSGWWYGNGVSVASSLSMLLPSMAGAKALSLLGKGASKGLGLINKSLDIASKMGNKARWMSSGISQAVTSRYIENMMEASGTFNDKYDEYIAKGMEDTLAKEMASEAASFNFNAGWAMLAQDIPQYLLIGKIFNPITGKVESKMAEMASKGAKPGYGKKIMNGLANMSGEGLEEGYQYIIAEEGKHLADVKAGLIEDGEFSERMGEYTTNGEMWTSVVFGALGGGLFQAVGPSTQELFKSKQTKENESNYNKIREEVVKRNAMAMAQTHDMVAKAQTSGDPSQVLAANMKLNLDMVTKALEEDKFDLHIETLNNLMKMTEEERATYAEQGLELNPELFKEYVPDMIKESKKIRKKYLKYRNKYDSQIASKMTYNSSYIEKFQELDKTLEKEIGDTINSIPNVKKMSTTGDNILKGKLNEMSLKSAKDKLTALKKRRSTKAQKEVIDKQIERLDKSLKSAVSKGQKYKAEDKRTAEEKKVDDEIYKGFRVEAKDLADKGSERIRLKESISTFQDELLKLSSETYQKEFKKNQQDVLLSRLTTREDIEDGYKTIEESDLFDDKEKKLRKEALDKRLVQIEKEEKKLAAEKEEERLKKASKAEQAVKDEKKTTIANKGTKGLEDGVDDHLSDYEPNLEDRVLDKQDKAADAWKGGRNDMRVLDTPGSDTFKSWSANGKNKIGAHVEYVLGDPMSANKKKAIATFELAKKNKDIDLLDDHVFDHLPIKVIFDKDPDKFSFIHDKESVGSQTAKNQKDFKNDEFLERRLIIKAMVLGKAESEISKQYGGNLIRSEMSENENGEMVYPNNDIRDLWFLKGEDISEIDIAVSNGSGILVGTDKKPHKKLPYLMTMDDPDTKGATIPYSGGVFLNVPKMDGHRFPLKLNLAKTTEAEADTISDLMIGYGVEKKFKYDAKLSSLPEDLYKKIKESHPEEMKLLGKDGTVIELLDTLVYISKQTENKNSELFVSGSMVRFGKGLGVSKKDIPGGKKELMKFLVESKRRQFSVKKWNTSNKYKKYLLDSGTLSTDGTINGPLFDTRDPANPDQQLERSGQFYIETLAKEDKVELTFSARADKSEKKGEQRNYETQLFEASYFDPDGVEHVYSHAIRSKPSVMVREAYENEIAGDPVVLPKKKKAKTTKTPEVTPEEVINEPVPVDVEKELTPKAQEAYDTLKKDVTDIDDLNDLIEGLNNSPKDKAIRKGAEKLLNELKSEITTKVEKKVVPSPKLSNPFALEKIESNDIASDMNQSIEDKEFQPGKEDKKVEPNTEVQKNAAISAEKDIDKANDEDYVDEFC